MFSLLSRTQWRLENYLKYGPSFFFSVFSFLFLNRDCGDRFRSSLIPKWNWGLDREDWFPILGTGIGSNWLIQSGLGGSYLGSPIYAALNCGVGPINRPRSSRGDMESRCNEILLCPRDQFPDRKEQHEHRPLASARSSWILSFLSSFWAAWREDLRPNFVVSVRWDATISSRESLLLVLNSNL